MLVDFLVVVVLACLVAWFARRSYLLGKKEQELQSALRVIDVAAFQNVLRSDDDFFLKTMLPPRHYRTAKRARTRAVQQYVFWIANDCSVFQLLVKIAAHRTREMQERAQVLTAMSFRVRVISLVLWSALWFQWAVPELDLMPGSLLGMYEGFLRDMHDYLSLGSRSAQQF